MNRVAVALAFATCMPGAQADTVCRLSSGPALMFGSYDVVSSSPQDSLTNVLVTCARDGGPQFVTVTLTASAGTYGSSINARRMARIGAPADFLRYGLFRDVNRTLVWGDNAASAVSQTLQVPNKSSATASFTLYGRIPALQDVYAGDYADSVQITLLP